eukprot:CAMPEP_0119124396 /NCGR_PEP_ID=MMETSP1310-20130426/4037_1 /TAXON_ID=464262 /ORGANISM="Genus nov. species nov., Strain RCC2339" /LENGTH=77 /DNA_ID=CAMNT_0007114345 /DNA_START=81 /DNA_END=310 /DNA_ORIENTATION=+
MWRGITIVWLIVWGVGVCSGKAVGDVEYADEFDEDVFENGDFAEDFEDDFAADRYEEAYAQEREQAAGEHWTAVSVG